MKRLIWIVFLPSFLVIQAQEKVTLKETKIGINTIESSTVSVRLIFDLEPGNRQRTSAFFRNNPNLTYSINSITRKEVVADANTNNDAIAGNNFIGFRFEAGTRLIEQIKAGDADYFIEINDTIIIEVFNDSLNRTSTYILTPEQVKENTRNKLIISDSEMNELIQSLGGEINMAANNIGVGFIPGEESSSGKTEYNLHFNYRTRYPFINKSPVFFQTSGILSTNAHDSMNFVRIFPIGLDFLKNHNEIMFQAGLESNQVFSHYRITGDFHWQGIIPNLVNLTYGANRLRMKPIIQAGFKIYKEIENNRPPENDNNVFSGLAYAQAYYYIPILKLYSLVIEGNTFYDFNTDVNPDKELKYLYSLTFGIEIPNSGIKTIVKYANGETDIGYAASSTILIGLLADLFTNSLK